VFIYWLQLNIKIDQLLLFVKYVAAFILITVVWTYKGWESITFDIEEYTCSFPSWVTVTLGLRVVDHKIYATVHLWNSNSNKVIHHLVQEVEKNEHIIHIHIGGEIEHLDITLGF
jgi:hypothetical protein